MCRQRRKRSRGAAAIEFVLITPLLLLLVSGTITFGLAGYAKFRLSDAAMVAVRRCVAVNPATCADTVQTYATTRWASAPAVCKGGLHTTIVNSNSIVTVTATCIFTGGVMQSYIGLSDLNVTTSAAMPY